MENGRTVYSASNPTDSLPFPDPPELGQHIYEVPPEIELVRVASASGDLDAVKTALEHWKNSPHDARFFGRFRIGISEAVKNDHVPIVAYLLSQGMKIHVEDFAEATKRKSYPMLHLLVDEGFYINTPMGPKLDPPALQQLRSEGRGTNPMVSSSRGSAGRRSQVGGLYCPLLRSHAGHIRSHQAALRAWWEHKNTDSSSSTPCFERKADCLEVIDFLLERGAPIHDIICQTRPYHMYALEMHIGAGTPLHTAAERGRLDVVKRLIKRGADPLIPDARRKTALERAEKSGHNDVAEYLRPRSVPPAAPRRYFTDQEGYHIRESQIRTSKV